MASFVTVSGAGVQVNGLMIPVASGSCADVRAGIQSFHDQVFDGSGGYTAVSCTNDPVVVGTRIIWNPSYTYTVSGIGNYQTGSFDVAEIFDPVAGGVLFSSVVSSIIILYLCSRSAGTILSFIRSLGS